MRSINEIIIHCTGTVPSMNTTVASVREYHIKHNGWKDIGYHYLITLDGKICQGRPIDQVGAHCKNHNTGTIGICYVGGLAPDGKTPKDTRSVSQKKALQTLVDALKVAFPTIKKVSGHNEYSTKPCPCFDVKKEFGR